MLCVGIHASSNRVCTRSLRCLTAFGPFSILKAPSIAHLATNKFAIALITDTRDSDIKRSPSMPLFSLVFLINSTEHVGNEESGGL